MADLQKTIQIIFGATDNASGVIDGIDGSIGGIAGSVETATQPLADLASNILKVEASIAALGVATFYYATVQASKLGDAESSLQKVLSESEGSVNQYADAIKNIALEYGVAGDAVTSSVANFKQAGFGIEDALLLIETSLTGVKIAELGAEEAGTLLIRNIKGLGVEADQAAHFMDAWNAVSNNYNATAKELAIATGRLAPIAKTAGLSFDELVGFVTPLIEKFGSGSEAANAFKVGLANVISDNKRVTDALGELGVAQFNVNGELRTGGDIIKDVAKLWSTLTESQKANYGLQLFGKEQFVKMNAVLDDYDKVLKATEISTNSQGSALDELAIAMQKASTASEKFNVALTYAASTVGKQYIESNKNVIGSLSGLIAAFDKTVSDGGLKPLFDFMNPLLDEFANNIDQISKNLPEAFKGLDFSGLISSFKDIGLEFGNIFDIDLTTKAGLQEGLQGIIDSLTVLNNVFAGVIEGFAPVINAFQSMAESARETDDDTGKFIGNIIGYGASVNVFSGWIGSLTGVFSALSDILLLTASAKYLGALPAGFASSTTGAIGLAKVLGKGGLWGALYGVSISLATMVGETDIVRNGLGKLFDAVLGNPFEEFESTLAKTVISESELAKENEKYRVSLDGVNDAHVKAYIEATKYNDAVNEMAKANEGAAQETKELELSQARLESQMSDLGLEVDGSANKFDKLNYSLKVTSGEFAGWFKVVKDGVVTYEKVNPLLKETATATDKLAEATKKAKEETEKAAKRAQELKIKYAELEIEMEGIASNERIKSMEFFVDLEIAKVEADAKKVVAAFDSISESYASTTNLIGSLYSGFGSLSGLDQLDLQASIKKAEDLAREQWESQKALIDAQIRQVEASTKKLSSGDSLITVDGGELQPELVAVMQSLFKAIRIEMSSEYENYLFALQP